ncbi:MAG: serine hydrolase domain-containing protein [Erythrobacter sp.]
MIDLQKTLTQSVQKHGVPSAAAMIGNSDKVIASAFIGSADPASGKPMALDSIFQIASMTKAITSLAAMQLVESGKLSLDDPIGAVLPELAEPQVLTGFDADDKPQTRTAETPITLRHLLTHTSGLGYPFTSADMAKAQASLLGEVVPGTRAAITSPLMFDPGSDWLYGVSTDYVGFAVEAASGQNLGDYFEEHIFAPLGMADTGFSVTPEKAARRVALHSVAEGGFMPFPLEIGGGDAAEFQSGGGGLYSTAPDYMRFMQMVLNRGELDGKRLLSENGIAAMSRNQIGNLRAGYMESVVPMLAHEIDNFPDMDTKWGLGFLINPETGPNGRAPGSLAWAGIANCYYWIDPASGIAGLVLMQYLPFGDERAAAVFEDLEKAAYQAD